MIKCDDVGSLVELIKAKLHRHLGTDITDATVNQMYAVCASIIRDSLVEKRLAKNEEVEEKQVREVHYLSMEFLIGRSLYNHLCNLDKVELFRNSLEALGFNLDDVLVVEKDAALGNGGLGRLAACYLDSLTTLEYPVNGYSIMYEYGIFRQKIIDGVQVELPDNWLEDGNNWSLTKIDEIEEIRFGGQVETYSDNGQLRFRHYDYSSVQAVPYDMSISGYKSQSVNTLRLWKAKSPNAIDMQMFSKGEYLKSVESKAMSEVISKVLYPGDDHYEGKSLRLKQQYFFVSATIQHITKKHKQRYGTLRTFAEKCVIHINDTHPTIAIAELMRIFLDEEGFSWEDAWGIVSKSVAYTNHTIMNEALERWSVPMFQMLLPRIFMIIEEINERFCKKLWEMYPGDWGRIGKLAIIANGEIRMAHLCIVASFTVNGVSALHSEILQKVTFPEFIEAFPHKFTNVTNGIAHRRWLSQSNPNLSNLIRELIGDDYLLDAQKLNGLRDFVGDDYTLLRLSEVKKHNKNNLAKFIFNTTGTVVNTDSIFDVQVKRIHEYKRQLLNVLHIMADYELLKANKYQNFTPRTYIFSGKAAHSYYMAKQIIRLINALASEVNHDKSIDDKIKVVFLEDYNVSLAEQIIPAAEVSEQISVAGREASGTSNMKLMLNGALTIGTLDGANIEICEEVGFENAYVFGLRSDEVERLQKDSKYVPYKYFQENELLQQVIEKIRTGVGTGNNRSSFNDIVNSLLFSDHYMVLADFAEYCAAQNRVSNDYQNKILWNKKSLLNIAGAGRFTADRSVTEYAEKIWGITPLN